MLFSVAIAISLFLARTRAAEWDYKDFEAWNRNWPRCGDQEHQSPRILNQQTAMIKSQCMNLAWFNDKSRTFDIRNNGHGLVFEPRIYSYETEANRFYAAGFEWCLVQFHFHWSQDDHGAEHRLEDFDNGIEAHFVHRRCDFATLADAVAEDTDEINTIAVIGILYEIGPDDLMARLFNTNTITPGLQKGTAQTVVYNFPYVEMLPPMESRQFYSYQGSLTTPTCDPVLWFVVEAQQKVSPLEMELLRAVEDADGNVILSNQRPLQANTQPLSYYQPCKARSSSDSGFRKYVRKFGKSRKYTKKRGKYQKYGKSTKSRKSQKGGKSAKNYKYRSSRRSGRGKSRRSRSNGWKY